MGVTSEGDLARLAEEKKKSGIALTCLGFGMGNYKDNKMEALADYGDGNCRYLDTIHEARKALVEEGGGTFVTVAKDVKIQVDFNPAMVKGYRLIGYEDRMMAAEDFANGIHWALSEGEYPSLSEAACRKVLTSYSESAIAKKYIEVYNKLTGDHD